MPRFFLLRFFVLFGGLCIFLAAPAGASTYRIEFDIIDSEIYFDQLVNTTTSETVDSEEYAAFTAEFHPVGAALGQTGPVTLELELGHPFEFPWEVGHLKCISGILCSTKGLQSVQGVDVQAFEYPHNPGFAPIFLGGYEWSLGNQTLSFFDDGGIAGGGTLDGDTYYWWAPHATFTLANLTATEINPVPLPASAPVLAAGVLVLGAVGMRRRTRRG